nr:hypothetical protein Iba_chr06aCG11070 [Ipomoea batatas]
MLPAKPFKFMGNTSDIKTHGIPPIPNEKDPVKTCMPTSAKTGQYFHCTRSCTKNDNPIRKQAKHVPEAEIISNGRLPDLSIRRTPTTVIETCTNTIDIVPILPEKPADSKIELA